MSEILTGPVGGDPGHAVHHEEDAGLVLLRGFREAHGQARGVFHVGQGRGVVNLECQELDGCVAAWEWKELKRLTMVKEVRTTALVLVVDLQRQVLDGCVAACQIKSLL